ncbi:MAG: SdiA-regulated domain-containing protein [Chitinophagaceae bacterium]
MKSISAIFLIVLLQLTKVACTEPPKTVNPPGYDLAKPTVYKMPSVLEEISGIALNHGKTDTIFAEQDEEGKLFYFHLGDVEVSHTKFSKRGDYEDVAICNGQVIMLRSDGVFFTFPLSGIGNKETGNAIEQEGLLPQGEYESLYADDNTNSIYVLCKNCSDDKSAGKVSGQVFSVGPDGKLALKDHFSIDEKAIAALAGKEKIKFKPSGLAANPITNQWYILSSVNKTLLITDAQWKPLNAYPLNPTLFTQPEGITFDLAGNLYIANEKGNAENGTILQFKYQKK